ncbi:MAG: outer membrane beta-barrel protein [Phycisphaerae bacterium]
MRPFTSLLAMAAVLATAGLSLADSTTPTAAPAAAPADTNPLLMYSLDQIKTGDTSVGQSLSNAGINIYGYLELGYTADLAGPPPAGTTIPGRVFDTEYGNHLQMDQLDLTIAKAINFSDTNYIKRGWDVGGKFEFVYGYDPSYGGDSFHSSGLDFGYNPSSVFSPLYQADIEQAYVTLALHLGGAGDVKFKAGKFVTLLGEETINPTTNYLYSHTYSFGYMIPYTQTGVLAEYVPNSQWTFYGGVTRGWNQTFYDNNSNGVDFLGEVGYAPNSQWDFIVNLSEGPQDGAMGNAGLGNNNDYRTVVEPLITYTPPILNNALTLVSDTVIAYDGAGNSTNGNQSSGWFSEALYQNYVLNSYFSFTTREEYDYVGSGLGSAGIGINPFGIENYTNMGDLTFGVKIIPFPKGSLSKNFYIRPEIREDLADHQVFNGKQYQTTFGIDAIYQF